MTSRFEIVRTSLGRLSIRDNRVGEILHNPIGPWEEANLLYIEPSKMRERITSLSRPFVVYDVGLGAMTNALAAIQAANARPLHILSFENDLEMARFALSEHKQFPFFTNFVPACEKLITEKRFSSETLDWHLFYGDFPKLIAEQRHFPAPDAIFFDAFSPKVNSEMWSLKVFEDLYRISAGRDCVLSTYTRATSIRAALLAAGFYVGNGPSVGAKPHTTIAATGRELLDNPLGSRWLEQWRASSAAYPPGTPEGDPVFKSRVENHPQFTVA